MFAVEYIIFISISRPHLYLRPPQARALALVQQCACRHGCPGCVQHTDCSEYNAVLHKQGAAVVLRRVMEADARALQLAGQA